MKKLLHVILLVLFTINLFANKVEFKNAKKIGLNAYYQKLNIYHQKTSFDQLTISDQIVIKENGEEVYYVFNFSDYGYIIISAEDAMYPVLGYSFENQYINEKLPENFLGWMQSRSDNIVYLRQNNISATTEIEQQWVELENFNPVTFSGYKSGKDIEPLLLCNWEQGNPYNYYCPEDPAGPGGHALVGCVATAMAQIMYHWRYPEQGSGSNSYYCPPYGTLSVNFGEATYEWDGMKNTTSSLNLPMALLSYHCGVGVNMSFGPDGSGIPSNQMNRVTNAFETYFNYSTAANHIYKTGAVTWTTWKTWIRDNLDDGCPVFYAGVESGPNPGGHAFVCDGYHIGDDNFHFNFGWGGYGNGWFPVTNPGGFPVSQAIVKNIYPADASYPPMCETEREISQFKGTFQDGSGPQENYDENADCSWIFVSPTEYDSISDITVKFNLLDTESDDIITIYDGESTSDPILGTFSGSITPGDVITSSGSKMLITFEADGDGVTGTGWQIEYDVSPYEWCEGTPILTEPTGILNDGSGDWYYSNGTSCVWQIEPDWADGLTISFTEFNTEEEEDVVEIRKYNWTLLASYSGEYTPGNMPDPVYIEDGKAYVIFLCNDANNNPGWTAEWEVGNVGVNNKQLNGYDLKIYPNPTNDFLSISFTIEETESIELKIFSVTGEVVYYENNRNLRGSYVNTIDLSEIAKGVYFLNLTSEKETINRKIIIN